MPKCAYAAHHIVAGNATGDKRARSILKKFGIGINDAVNGVFLSQSHHRKLHINAYYEKVNDLLEAADSKEEAIEILNDIARQLRRGKF